MVAHQTIGVVSQAVNGEMGGVTGAENDASDTVLEGIPCQLVTYIVHGHGVVRRVALHASRKGRCKGHT